MKNRDLNIEHSKKDGRTRLLKLIEEGDATTILSEEHFGEKFNDLVKYELVAIKKDKVSLTAIGKHALRVGVKSVIEKIRNNVAVAQILRQDLAGGKI